MVACFLFLPIKRLIGAYFGSMDDEPLPTLMPPKKTGTILEVVRHDPCLREDEYRRDFLGKDGFLDIKTVGITHEGAVKDTTARFSTRVTYFMFTLCDRSAF
jgi:hypothetical protein